MNARDIRRTGWLGAKPKVYVYGEVTIGDTVVVGQRVDDPREDLRGNCTVRARMNMSLELKLSIGLALTSMLLSAVSIGCSISGAC